MSIFSVSYNCRGGSHLFVGDGNSGNKFNPRYQGATVTVKDRRGVRYIGTMEIVGADRLVIGDTGLPIKRVREIDEIYFGVRLEEEIEKKYRI